jgi:hypothetical protein
MEAHDFPALISLILAILAWVTLFGLMGAI